ncbi:MAG: CCA tRNA nucleotidyltransferase [Lentisphaeria bacterium]|nr:CCA tRNA nucleotidyltransferase [Lentisphaeria bacterium]
MAELHSAAPGFYAASGIADKLIAAGFQTALVGGSVRDLLLSRTPSDFDLVTVARPEEITKVFPDAKLVGASFGVVIIRYDGIDVEVASARSERSYMDGRHPEEVSYTRDLAQDALRRDFTVNALMYDFAQKKVLDFTGGVADLKRGILRTVGDPGERFREDYLRILRAVRFAAKLGFVLDDDLAEALRSHAPQVAELSCERIFSELDSMLTGRDPERAIRLLEELGILKHLLPEIAILRTMTQPPQFHPEGDVLEHTLLMLRHMVLPTRCLAWSVLLHDVGKSVTRSVDSDGRIRFFGHEDAGSKIAENICRRLRFSNSDMELCLHAVRNHMRFASVQGMKVAKLRRLIGDPGFAMELELHRLDCLCSNGLMDGFNFLIDRVAELPGASVELPEPWVRGRDLIKNGIKPQVKFKRVLDTVYERQLAGEFPDVETALSAALEMF